MAEASAPPWAGDAGHHKDAETTSAPAPMMFTDAAVTSTLSGQPVLSGAVAGASAYAGPVDGKSAWQKDTYRRFAGMACGLQLILAALLLSTTLPLLDVDDIYSYERVEVEVVDGKGDVRLNPDGDLRLYDISNLAYYRSDAYYSGDYWYEDEMWLDYGVSASYEYGYYDDEVTWDADTPRNVMMHYTPVDFDTIAVEVSHDWDNRNLSIVTDLWLNHSNTTSTVYSYGFGGGERNIPIAGAEGNWTINYSSAGVSHPCDLGYFEFLVPHPNLDDDERVRFVTSMMSCWSGTTDVMSTEFEIYPYVYGVEVGEWSPDNSTLWFDNKQLGTTTLNLELGFENVVESEKEDRRWAAQGTMLTVAPIASLLGIPILAIVGGVRKGRSAAWGAITGFLLMPASFIFWLWAGFATW
mgnify:FL=1